MELIENVDAKVQTSNFGNKILPTNNNRNPYHMISFIFIILHKYNEIPPYNMGHIIYGPYITIFYVIIKKVIPAQKLIFSLKLPL